jgi:catechol 2,3-dioxygenase-like lactoylglutathione lyase family enzyme
MRQRPHISEVMKSWPLVALAVLMTVTSLKSQETKRPRILGLSHIALFAHDTAASLKFYKEFLGFDEQFRLNKPGGGLDVAFIKINDRQNIELFTERDTTSNRLYQLALETDDAESMRRYLAVCGLRVPEKVSKGRIGNLSFSVKDPDGHIVEFVQYQPEGWTMLDHGKHAPTTRISVRLKHIGFAVDSLNRSMKFYRDILGFVETWRGSADGSMLSWVNLKVPEGDEYVELMLYREAPSAMRLGSMNHMSLEVPDIAKAAELLQPRSSQMAYGRPLVVRTGINRKRQLNLFDPDSTRVELMEPTTVDGLLTPSSAALPPK